MNHLWTKDSIPLNSVSEKAQHNRDMLYSKAHYEHKSEGSSEEEATVLNDQLNLWPASNVTDAKNNPETDPEIELVSFRELVPEISDTGYLTHAIFYYPAKFIPHVVRYALKSFTKEGDWVVDPFAGSGTVGVEAYLCRRNSFLLDLNPLLNHMIPLKIYDKKQKLNKDRGSCLIRVHRKLLCDKRRDEVNSDTFEIEGEFTDSHIATEQPFMHTTERA